MLYCYPRFPNVSYVTLLRQVYQITPKGHQIIQHKVNTLQICVADAPKSHISIRLPLWPSFSSYMAIWNKCSEWPQNDFQHPMVKGTHICIIVLLVSPSSKVVNSMTSRFPLAAYLRQVYRMTSTTPSRVSRICVSSATACKFKISVCLSEIRSTVSRTTRYQPSSSCRSH